MTDSSSPDSSPASRNTFAHHLGMKGFLLMEGLLKLVGMKTLYRLGRAAGAGAGGVSGTKKRRSPRQSPGGAHGPGVQ